MKFLTALFTAFSLLLSSCATIVSSQQKPTKIDSSPSKMAYVVTDANGVIVSQGITPSQVTLNRSSGYFQPGKYTIEIKKGGKVVSKEMVTASLNGWYFGNILVGGLIGMLVVDPLSGAMYRMPETITVNTTSVASVNQAGGLQIVDISTLSTAQRTKLVHI